jgi:hypothetical protein
MPMHRMMLWHCRCILWLFHYRSRHCCAERWQSMSTAATRGRKGDANASNDALAPSLPPLAAPPSFPLFPSPLCREAVAYVHKGTVVASAGRSTIVPIVPIAVVQRGSGICPQQQPEDAEAMRTHRMMR